MSVTDPISDMLTRIRNAYGALHKTLAMPASKMKAAIAVILKEEGYINDFSVADGELKITLKYSKGTALVSGLKRKSRPGRRIYVGVEEIPKVQNGLGICILSTSAGVLEGSVAKSRNFGGELLCEVW